jgi:hypothetical protein
MLADIHLVVGANEARVTVRHDNDVVEDECWKFDRRLSREEAKSAVAAVFADVYDMMNFAVHGDE